MKKICNIMLTIGIIWIMMDLCYYNSYAASSFTKRKLVGVMSTAVNDKIVVTWEAINNADGYRVFEALPNQKYHLVCQTKKCKVILKKRTRGVTYRYFVKAYRQKSNGKRVYSKASKKVATTVSETGISTIKNLLQTAITPMGSTMYVWGGGWNKADTAAGKEARRTGLSATWRSFARNKTSSYNYRNYRYQIHDGLDCSGYVGWCIYNVMNTKNNQKGYVYSASKQAGIFSKMGMGDYMSADVITNYQAGDIMSSTCSCCGHVWIVIGQCGDGSVVLVHSSPAGVQLSGTTTPDGKQDSEAYALAKKYMKQYYPSWYKRYPNVSRGSAYLSHYGQMRWRTTGEGVYLSDPEGYQNMTAEEVLKDLYHTIK